MRHCLLCPQLLVSATGTWGQGGATATGKAWPYCACSLARAPSVSPETQHALSLVPGCPLCLSVPKHLLFPSLGCHRVSASLCGSLLSPSLGSSAPYLSVHKCP